MNWGMKIVLVLAIFIIGIVSAGIYMVTQNQDTLEEGDYYEKGIEYDVLYEQKQNLIFHQATPLLTFTTDSLLIRFHKPVNQGVLYFHRPADDGLDAEIAFKTNENHYWVPLKGRAKGAWKVQIQWENEETPFWYEQTVFLP